jgi:hypothetical protein
MDDHEREQKRCQLQHHRPCSRQLKLDKLNTYVCELDLLLIGVDLQRCVTSADGALGVQKATSGGEAHTI